jgi:hypothetical protein
VLPFGIEFPDEVIEASLLLEAIGARRPDGLFLAGEVHALMAPVLLRALDIDTEAQSPDGELGEVEQGIRACEGYSVVRAYCIGEAALAEKALESREGEVLAGALECLAQEQVARGMNRDGEGIAIASVA